MNVAFSREMGALTVTETWLSLPWAVKTQLIDAIDAADGIGDLSPAQQAVIRYAQREQAETEKAWDESNQRRKPNGQFDGSTGAGGGGGGGAAGAAMAALSEDDREGAETIQNYLKMTTQYEAGPGMATTPDKLVLEHGKAYATGPDTYAGKRGTPHHCYENATKRVLQNPDLELTYVEGYMTVHGIPLKHAWAVDKRGLVVDPTIKPGPEVKGYFGVAFSNDYVRATMMQTRMYGVISMSSNRDMFRNGPPPTAFAKIGSK